MERTDQKAQGLSKARLSSIFDAGTFVELGAYTKRAGAQNDLESVVCGYGAVNGRLVFAFLQDSGRTKGAFGERHAKKIASLYGLAVQNGAPIIGVFDSAGTVVYDGAQALAAYGRLMKNISDASGIVPQIAVIDGVCGGSCAVAASMFDFVVTVKGKSELFVNAPFAVGEAVSAPAQGLSAYDAENEADAFGFVRSLLGVLPQNNAERSVTEASDDLNRKVSFDPASYEAEALAAMLADGGKVIRLYRDYTAGALFGFAFFGGVLTGLMACDPKEKGILDIRTARAFTKLLSFCDSFSIPVVNLVDSEGLDVTAEAERAAYASELARLAMVYTSSKNAKISVVIGKAYGGAFTLLGSKSVGADMAFALPDACVSVLSPEASVAFVWNDKVGEQSREALAVEWKNTYGSARNAADEGEIDDIIEPSELRQRICAAVGMLSVKAEGKPERKHVALPL